MTLRTTTKSAARALRARRSLLPLLCLLPASVAAQLPMRATVIKDATLLVGDGSVIEGGSIVISGEKITAVGKSARGGMMARSIPASGKFVTPGLIDAWATLSIESVDAARSAAARAADGFDRYDRHSIDAALQQGVTLAYVPARTLSGVGGLGAVVRLLSVDSGDDPILQAEAAICGGVGADGRISALQRVRSAAEFRKLWLDARQYRKSLETYEEELKEYEERVKKRAEENKDGKKDEKKEEKKDEKPADDKEKEATPPAPTPQPRPDRPRPPRPRPGQPPRGGGETRPPPAASQTDAGKRDEKKDDLKKPTEPKKDAGKDTLLKAIDGKLVVRVEAHRPEDILNALEIGREFNLALIIEGGTGAHLVADKLAAARASVVLSPAPPDLAFEAGAGRYSVADAAGILSRAGVSVAIGSGPAARNDAAPRHLALLAAAAAGAGMDANQALRAVTGGAAEMLGIAGDYGTLSGGRYADLVIWSAHPMSPEARVEQVFVHGKEVYRAASATGDDKADEKPAESQAAETAEEAK